jgi:hypothetical protein
MFPLVLLLAVSGQPHAAPGTVLTYEAVTTCHGSRTEAVGYQVVENTTFRGETFFVCSGCWQPIMAGARVQVVERGFGLVVLSEGWATNDGRMLSRGMLRKPIGW